MRKIAKKALAFTLATSMAFSVAPVAPLASNIALAAETGGSLSSVSSVELSMDGKLYQAVTLDKISSYVGVSVEASVPNSSIVKIGIAKDKAEIPNVSDLNDTTKVETAKGKIEWSTTGKLTINQEDGNNTIFIEAQKAGDVSITLTPSNTNVAAQTIDVVVKAAEKVLKVTDVTAGSDKSVEIKNGDQVSTVAKSAGIKVKVDIKNYDTTVDKLKDKSTTATSGYVISDESIVKSLTYADGVFTIVGEKTGATNISFYLREGEDKEIFTFTVNVIAKTELSTTIDGKTYANDGSGWKLDGESAEPIIKITQSNQSAKLVVTSNNGNTVTYKGEANDVIVVGNDGSIDAILSDGKVQAKETKIKVSVAKNNTTGQEELDDIEIKVQVTPDAPRFPSVVVKDSEGKILSEAGTKVEYNFTTEKFDVKNSTATAEKIVLSTKDKASANISIEANVDSKYVDIKSSNGDVFTYKDGEISAVAQGSANLVITVNPDTTSEQNTAKITIPVEVKDIYTVNEIKVTNTQPIVLTAENPSAVISATATYGNKLSYSLAEKNGEKYINKDLDAGSVKLNGTTNELTYQKDGKSGTVYVAISGVELTDVAVAPETVYVEVQYGDLKNSDLAVAAKRIDVKVGDVVSAGATVTGQEIEYTSDSENVATVAKDGSITAVSAGTAVITVKAVGNGVYKSAETTITVVVSAATVAKKANPITVTAKKATVKYTKVKKAAQKLAVSKVLTIKNAKGTKTFTKKSGNSKITINKSTGKVTVKKGLKKGTYSVKVTVKAAGNASYKSKTVTKTFKVVVK